MFGNFAATLTGPPNTSESREPPPPATPLEFSRLRTVNAEDASALSSDEILGLFSASPRNGPGINYLSALHVRTINDVELEDLISRDYLPPATWLAEPNPDHEPKNQDVAITALSNGAPRPNRAVFYQRVKELLLSNDAAFNFLQSKPQPGPPIRIAHFRKFWNNLLAMAEYWDTSQDRYTTVRESHRTSLRSISRSPLRSLSRSPFRKRSRSPARNASPARAQESPVRETYTGRRIGCGASMPMHIREDAICTLVEIVAWAFRCRVERPKMEPKLQMGGMMLPILQNGTIYRTPKEMQKARKGIVEGPLMAIQCRNVHTFKREGETEGEAKGEVLDLLKEIGLALLIAQKRLREGTTETTSWEGKWWIERPRWGGGSGKQISIVEATSKSKSSRPGEDVKRMPEQYIKLHPPTSTWDRNVEYKRIGKDPRGEFDDIYIISSINHHVSILRFRIAPRYTEVITGLPASQAGPDGADGSGPWSVLSVQRSRWYDLLNVDDRGEAVRGIWGVFDYLMRDTSKEGNQDIHMGGT